jgi:hypothetical protein
MLSMISVKPSIGRLEDKVAIPIDGRLQGVGLTGLGYYVDTRREQLTKAKLYQVEAAEGCKAAGDFLEAHGNINIGAIARLVTSGRTEQRKAHDAKLAQLRCVGL